MPPSAFSFCHQFHTSELRYRQRATRLCCTDCVQPWCTHRWMGPEKNKTSLHMSQLKIDWMLSVWVASFSKSELFYPPSSPSSVRNIAMQVSQDSSDMNFNPFGTPVGKFRQLRRKTLVYARLNTRLWGGPPDLTFLASLNINVGTELIKFLRSTD